MAKFFFLAGIYVQKYPNIMEIDNYLQLKAVQDKTYNCQSLLETLENP